MLLFALASLVVRYFYYILISINCLSATTAQDYVFQNLSSDGGLIFGYNDHLLKRKNGTVWISSDNGIYEFNGLELKRFAESTTPTFNGEIVLSGFHEFSNEDILFTTDKGLIKFSASDGIFETIIGDNPIFSNEYYLIAVINEEYAWTRLGDSLYKVDLYSHAYEPHASINSVRFDHFQSDGNILLAGCPWLEQSGIELFSIDANGELEYKHISPKIQTSSGNAYPQFSDVVITEEDRLWAVSNQGLFDINLSQNNDFKWYTPFEHEQARFMSIALETDSTLWLTSKDKGTWRFNTRTKQFDNNQSTATGLHSDETRKIYIDSSDFHWISSFKTSQVSYGKPRNAFFESIETADEFDATLPFDFIYNHNKNIKAFSPDGIIEYAQDGEIVFKNYLNTNGEIVRLDNIYNVTPSVSTSDYWLTSADKIYTLDSSYTLNQKFQFDSLRILYFDQLDSDQALVLTNVNLNTLNLNTGQLDTFNLNGLTQGVLEIYRLLKSDGRHFIVHNDRRLYELLPKERILSRHEPIECQSSIHSLTADNEQLLIGTSNGIEVFDNRGRRSKQKVYAPEFINIGSVNKIFTTDSSYVVTTSNGLITCDTAFSNWRIFSKSDGLFSDQFISNTGLQLETNEYFLPVQNGIIKVDLSIPPETIEKPVLLLNNLMVNDQLRKAELMHGDSVFKFRHFENSFNLTPTSITYQSQDKNQLFYRIERDSPWKKIANGSDLFLRLNSGTYDLQFIGTNANGALSDIRSLKLEIAVPFWRTLSFFIASILAVCLIIFFVVRSYYRAGIRKREEKFAQERALAAQLEIERNRIASEMHDELGGGLTSIRLLSQKMLSTKNQNQNQNQHALKKVEKYSTELVDNMRSIVWSMDSAHNSLGETTTYFQHYIDDVLENGGIEAEYEIDIANADLELSSTIRRNLYLIIKEILTNVLKHSKATKVRTSMIQDEDLIIEIGDNGIGLNESSSSHFGNGIRNIRRRIEDINGEIDIQSQEGTRITIKLNLDK